MAIKIGGNYVTANLQCYLNSADSTSYPGSGTTWYDLSGNGKHATLVNSPTFVNNSIVFNGTNQYANVGNFGSFYSQGTISFLMNASAFESYRNPFHTHYLGGNAGIRFEENGGGFGVNIGNDGGTSSGQYIKATGMTSNQWYYISVTWDTVTAAVTGYLNGIQQFSAGFPPNWPTTMPSVTLGGGFSVDRYFKGSIMNLSIYNRELTATEILQNYGALGITYDNGTVQVSKYDGAKESGRLLSISTFATAGTFTWSKPSACTRILVRLVGGGGGSSGYNESGGGGGYSEKMMDATTLTTVTVTVGAGGAATAYSGSGGLGINGSTTSFGSYCSASGGYGANRNSNHLGGQGGVGSGGDVNTYGGTGTGHANACGTGAWGKGGTSFFGGAVGNNRNANAAAGTGAPGAGGTGANTDGGSFGGPGETGIVIIWEYQ